MGGLTHGELFAGIGGFSVGFEQAGIETTWQVEINPASQKVLRAHYKVPLLSDVRECGAQSLLWMVIYKRWRELVRGACVLRSPAVVAGRGADAARSLCGRSATRALCGYRCAAAA